MQHLVAGLRHLHVRYDAEPLNRTAGWCVITCRREPYGSVIGQRDHRLHRAFAETARANQYRTSAILQCSRDDLAGRCGTAVDKYHHRCATKDISALGAKPLGVLDIASTCGYDLTLSDEIGGDGYGLIE